jgi:hypothetical protein
MSRRRSIFRTLNDLAWWGVAGAAVYWYAVRPWHTRWGASEDEARRSLPGDELVPRPRIDVTHAVGISRPPKDVWPWIAQLGQGRGGFYSYTWVENRMGLDMHNADRILPEFQNPKVGDKIPLAPDDFGVPIALLERERMLVMHGDTREGSAPFPQMREGDFLNVSWGFYLQPVDGGQNTRLVERFRADWNPGLKNTLYMYGIIEAGGYLMERKMLLGIKQRVETLS